MKKLLLVTIVAFSLNGCRYINTTEPYKDAKELPELSTPEDLDKPNMTSTLQVPQADKKAGASYENDLIPPDMPIRTQQSEDAKKSIRNRDGFAILSVKTDVASAWSTMNKLSLENWSILKADESSCTMTVNYSDQDARKREKANFIKRMFTRTNMYNDYSGDFNLTCIKRGSIVEIKFSKTDGTVPKPFLADNVMTSLYGQF